MTNKIDYDDFLGEPGETPVKLTKRDLIAYQAMMFVSVDDLTLEIENRLYPDTEVLKSGLEAFKTDALIDELIVRAQKIAMLIVASQNALTMGEAVLSIGNLFGGTSISLDGYSDHHTSELTGSKDA